MTNSSLLTPSKHIIIGKLTEKDYIKLKDFFPNYKLFENLTFSFNNATHAINEYQSMLEETTEKTIKSINELHKKGIYETTVLIFILRSFVDNAKSYQNATKSSEVDKIIKKTEDNDDMKLLKALRDYSQHFSISITNTARKYDVLKGEYKEAEFKMYKRDLLRNKGNKKNLETIKNYKYEEIVVNNLFDEWKLLVEKLYCNLLDWFVGTIHNNVINLLKDILMIYKEDNNKYGPIIVDNTDSNKNYLMVFDELVLEYIISKVKYT